VIDTTRERLIALSDVPAYLQQRGLGRRVHVSAVYRWVRGACDGIRLEAVKIGGLHVTSAEAIQRWVEARQQPEPPALGVVRARATVRPDHARRREEARRRLEEYRLAPTQLDRLLEQLTGFAESTRRHVGSRLFRAGMRTPDHVRAIRLCRHRSQSASGLLPSSALPLFAPRTRFVR
jgi:hypothetical protein